VRETFRRFRGLGLALAVLGLSATMVLAAKPDSSQSPACDHGQSATHTDQTGCTTPGTPGTDNGDQGTGATNDTETTDTETTDTETTDAGGDHCATDPTSLSVDALAAMNHGSIVCWAAHQTTLPASYANHGAFVSHWAHQGKNSASENGTTHGKATWGQSHKP
jgi:hypothetical protein